MQKKQEKLNFSVLETIEQISIALSKSKLSKEATEKIKPESLKLAGYLDVTEQQAWFFALIYVQQYLGFVCDLNDIMNELDLKAADLVKYRQDIAILIDKRYVKSSYERRKGKVSPLISFKNMYVYEYITDAINLNITLDESLKIGVMDIYEFCNEVSDLILERYEENINTSQLMKETELLEAQNRRLAAIKTLKDAGFSIQERVMLYETCDDMVRGGGDTALEKTIRHIFDSQRERNKVILGIIDNKSLLTTSGYVSLINAAFVNDIKITLSPLGVDKLLGEEGKLFMKKQTLNDVIDADSIAKKQMFFEEGFQKQLDFFQSSLMQEKFTEMQERLKEMSMPSGIAAVFYGAPGTGKTESVYQIAKATGRDVFFVDISQTKSMWFGESEKKIKAIFNDYNRLCLKSEIKPILLFNEADAVLGKRKDNNASNVAQTENAIQNIILEQLEKSEGIIIATTNLADNLDAAFERRFLFKLKFELPTLEAKKQIWKSKLIWLDDESCSTLAKCFQFSGGEIDNIARKALMTEVLNGKRATVDELIQYCNAEKLIGKREIKLGFN